MDHAVPVRSPLSQVFERCAGGGEVHGDMLSYAGGNSQQSYAWISCARTRDHAGVLFALTDTLSKLTFQEFASDSHKMLWAGGQGSPHAALLGSEMWPVALVRCHKEASCPWAEWRVSTSSFLPTW